MRGEPDKTRVLLIYPPATTLAADTPTPEPPLGLAYIAAYLEQHGFEVRILDALAEGVNVVQEKGSGLIRVGLPDGEIAERIKEFKPRAVGVSCSFTANVPDSLSVARIVKNSFPEALVVFGGAHTSADPGSVLKSEFVDVAITGEGENTFLELLHRIEQRKQYLDLKGIGYESNNQIVVNDQRELIFDLDTLPFPARHLLPMRVYLREQERLRSFSKRQPKTTLITSRGCPRNCVFCSVKTIWGRNWRPRSPESVVKEIETLKEEYGVREFYFLDDNVSTDRGRLLEICNLILDKKLDITWATPNGITWWTLDEELLKMMKRSGCYRATFGIESGSKSTLKFIGKPRNLDKAKRIIRLCHKIGLWTHSTFVIGFPYETRAEIEETIRFAQEAHLDFASFYIATPYAGTRLREVFEKEGLLSDEDNSDLHYYSINIAGYDTVHLSRGEINELKEQAYKQFFLKRVLSFINPLVLLRELIPKINSFENLKYFYRLASNVLWAQIRALRSGKIEIHRKK